MTAMLAASFDRFGGPDVVRVAQREVPRPRAGEVVVRVAASSVNPTDVMMRNGQQSALMADLVAPYTAGVEFAGHVHELGEGVAGLAVGQPVMGIVNARRPEGGAHAQYVCVPAASLAVLTPDADLVAAATVPMNGLTARMAVEGLDLAPGSAVLVTGGAGAAGGYAIQLAREAGLVVLADARDDDAALVRQLGASHVLPRGEGLVAAVLGRFPQGVDGMIDCALIADKAARALRDGAPVVTLRRACAVSDRRLRPVYINVFSRAEDSEALSSLAALLAAGRITPRVAMRLPLPEAALASRLVEGGGLRGRVVLILQQDDPSVSD